MLYQKKPIPHMLPGASAFSLSVSLTPCNLL